MAGKYSFPKMLKSSLESCPSPNQSLLVEFKNQEGVNMNSQLRDYGNFHGFDLSSEMELSATPKRMQAGFRKPSWLTLKPSLFNAHIRKKLRKAIRENATNEKMDGEFNR